MSDQELPVYSEADARRFRRGLQNALLLGLPGWGAAFWIIIAAGLGAWPLALGANCLLTAALFGLLALHER